MHSSATPSPSRPLSSDGCSVLAGADAGDDVGDTAAVCHGGADEQVGQAVAVEVACGADGSAEEAAAGLAQDLQAAAGQRDVTREGTEDEVGGASAVGGEPGSDDDVAVAVAVRRPPPRR
jgi:hypothetical protein